MGSGRVEILNAGLSTFTNIKRRMVPPQHVYQDDKIYAFGVRWRPFKRRFKKVIEMLMELVGGEVVTDGSDPEGFVRNHLSVLENNPQATRLLQELRDLELCRKGIEQYTIEATQVARDFGLEIRIRGASCEVSPPGFDKRRALLELVERLERLGHNFTSVMYVGDDSFDVSAFDALDELEQVGRLVVRGVVESPATPALLRNRADLHMDQITEFSTYLQQLGIMFQDSPLSRTALLDQSL